MSEFEGFVLIQAMLGDQFGEKGAVDAPRHVVPGRNGEECARVVVEAHGVVEACGLRDSLRESASCPRGCRGTTTVDRGAGRVVPGQRREFAAVGRLIEGEENDA